MLIKLYKYFSGQIQYISKPKWLSYVSVFLSPKYIGNNTYQFLWIKLKCDVKYTKAGYTYFQYLRNKRNE